MDAVVDDALHRATTLKAAGFGALMVENFGDIPFYADAVPPETVAALAVCVRAVAGETAIPVGVNVLRNDALAALGIAAVTGSAMLRVNVLTGSMETDQGPIVGRAAELVRRRQVLAPECRIWADVMVKHATPPPGLTLEQSADDTWHRGGADALIVSGSGTGHAPDTESLERLRSAVPDAPLVIGSGADPVNVARFGELVDHIIVGTALEVDGRPGADLDDRRIEVFLAAADAAGLL